MLSIKIGLKKEAKIAGKGRIIYEYQICKKVYKPMKNELHCACFDIWHDEGFWYNYFVLKDRGHIWAHEHKLTCAGTKLSQEGLDRGIFGCDIDDYMKALLHHSCGWLGMRRAQRSQHHYNKIIKQNCSKRSRANFFSKGIFLKTLQQAALGKISWIPLKRQARRLHNSTAILPTNIVI